LWCRSLASTALLAVLLIPWVVLLFATAFVALSWLALVAIPVTVTLAILVHHGVVSARWWHEAPARGSVGAVLVAFTTLTVAGALLATAPSWLRVPIAAGAGLVNAWCWLRITDAIAGRDHARRAQVDLVPARPRRPFVVAALVAVMGLVVAGTVVGFVVSKALEDARVGPPLADPAATGLPVLVVKGFNSRWDGDTLQWVRGDFFMRRFSYAGLDARGEPRPYSRHTTHQSGRSWR
jgi:hypothetical protein